MMLQALICYHVYCFSLTLSAPVFFLRFVGTLAIYRYPSHRIYVFVMRLVVKNPEDDVSNHKIRSASV